MRFSSRLKKEFFTSDPPTGGEFEKLGEKTDILAGGSRPAVLAPPLLSKVEKEIFPRI
ncbi:MAG: hypothetical protein WD187_03010 [Candidatus Woykebacteria bacterium]